ncbi:AAA family ATPase [Desulfatibacillum aliphaticivorans]|uniref:AAA family ATPase n=1 Tax=Desulfatibacillum aliphaticivorans TaxID=218208 RepID=UPI0003F943E7|nr:ATP-binding protein [Desulfatibacillum aliphaticivorans]
MQHKMAMTKNVRRFLAAVHELRDRPFGVEGMGLLFGIPGEGKSTTVAYATNAMNGIFVRAMSSWTVTTMMGALMVELGYEPLYRIAPMANTVTQALMEEPRPIFVDEADYLFRQPQMVDTLRDIYDVTGSPVILIGMELMARKIRTNGRFARRITQWIEFKGIDLADARVLADTMCEVGIDDVLLAYIHKEACANIGRMSTALSKVETFGKTNGMGLVTMDHWGDRPLFYDQPDFTKRGK